MSEPITIDTTTTLANSTAKLVRICRNGVEVAYKDRDGVWHVATWKRTP